MLPTGAIFTKGTDDLQAAFKYALYIHNTNDSQAMFKADPVIRVVDSDDPFKVAKESKYWPEI